MPHHKLTVEKSIATSSPLHLTHVVIVTHKFMLLAPAGYKSSSVFVTLEIAIHYYFLNTQKRCYNSETLIIFYLVQILSECFICVCSGYFICMNSFQLYHPPLW